ncbi:hypothetical protein EC973_007037 [Apophysomyces ossiformis]|uniref:Zn(2)-C6 fungal-type domain-containing protein n=1 Tax=Apophysomyces ossiformis TaxID=679940 RepID=A0A8H7BUN6_9FUNG|nr:hypothetical protein EC973_007037 [Apophysomyces ossiformis]
MQSLPYYQQGYQATAYPTTASPASSSVMSNANPAIINQTNGLPPLQQPAISEATAAVAAAVAVAPQTAQQRKRKQVKNACTNCQKACKKCDDARPCPRCVKYGIADSCVNSVRKERKKGIKRGPYKRRQKPEEKAAAAASVAAAANKDLGSDQTQGSQGQYTPAAMRTPQLPFGYPSNLNQYGQPYDPYGPYAAYHKDQMSYVVSPVYPSLGYPVLVAGNGENAGNNQNQQQQAQTQSQQQQAQSQSQEQQSYPATSIAQQYNGLLQQSSQQSRPMTGENLDQTGSPQAQDCYSSDQAVKKEDEEVGKTSDEVKKERMSPEQQAKPQPMTPVPSTSTSSITSSPQESTEDEEGSKFARLTQLCSAALHHDNNRTESENSQQS